MTPTTPLSSCTAQLRTDRFCDHPSLPDAPFPICVKHAAQLYAFLNGRMGAGDQLLELRADCAVNIDDAAVRRFKLHAMSEVVYYVCVGDLVKIGRTSSMADRMSYYPPNSELLAVEPGGQHIEGQRHVQFADLLAARREWFRYEGALVDHVVALRAPPPTTPA